MKPLHANLTRLSRCPCCQSKYSINGARKLKVGKKAARAKSKRDTRKQLAE